MAVIAEALGHADERITRKHYAHLAPSYVAETIREAVAGLGIVCEPDFLVGEAVADGRLTRVLQGFEAAVGEIWAVYPSHRHLSLKVRLFVDHVRRWFDQNGAPHQ